MLVLCGLGLLVVGAAGAVPKPPPKYWSVALCERVLPEEHPKMRQVLCVPSGGPSTCHWTSGHHARLYSELTVFVRYRQLYVVGTGANEPGVVRWFTLATRARPGFHRIVHRYGDAWVGQPADFFMAHRRLLATHVAQTDFRSTVAPIAARLMQAETTSNCTAE